MIKTGGWKRYVVELGMGIDQHGQDPTRAAERAVKDAISRVCLVGLEEIFGDSELRVEVLIGVPHHEWVELARVEEAIPFNCEKSVKVVEGGLSGKGIKLEEFGDKTDEIIVAVACITIYVKV